MWAAAKDTTKLRVKKELDLRVNIVVNNVVVMINSTWLAAIRIQLSLILKLLQKY